MICRLVFGCCPYRDILDMGIPRTAARFAISGVIATLVHVLVAAGSIQLWSFEQSTANALAFCVATPFSYFLNTRWSFASRVSRTTAARFLVVAIMGAFWSYAVGAVFEYCRWHYLLGIGVIVLTLPPITFSGHLLWTYRQAPKPLPQGAAGTSGMREKPS